ncbi:MAG: heme exporter protein A [Lentisphaeria bacterium]
MGLALTLKNLSCERDERVLFSGLSIQFEPGDLVQIAGPNGAGKTTLLRMLCGISDQYEGELLWCGEPLPNYNLFSSLLYFGHLPGIKSSLTPLENLRWFFGVNGRKAGNGASVLVETEELKQALAEVGLAGYENVPAHHMSTGQQRRVALARLYVSKAPLWILDEPFTAIDKQGVAALELKLMAHAESGGIVVLTTHQAPSFSRLKVVDLGEFVPSSSESRHTAGDDGVGSSLDAYRDTQSVRGGE